MNYREDAFKNKLGDAAHILGVKLEQVSSFKLRENVSSYSEYRDLLSMLKKEFNLQYNDVDGNFQGKGYLLSDGKSKVIIVEHETGLEILYIAGSIASLISIIPLILQGWRAIRNHLPGRHHIDIDFRGAEIRRLDTNGHLMEDHVHDMHGFSFLPIGVLHPLFASATGSIENDIKIIIENLQSLTLRVDALEKQYAIIGGSNKTSAKRKSFSKKGVKKPKT